MYNSKCGRIENFHSQALGDALPKRFEWRRGPAVELPWHYASALLEAAVAAAVRRKFALWL